MNPATPKPYHPEADKKPRPWDEWGAQEQGRAMIKWLGRNFFEIVAWVAWVEDQQCMVGR